MLMKKPVLKESKIFPANISGFFAALGAYVIWGIFPLYMKAVAHIPVMEVVVYRVLWSLPIALGIIIVIGHMHALRDALMQPKMVAMAFLTSALITANWSIYIWAIANNHAVDAALGYYINPLVNVMLALVFLHERLNPWQWFSIALAFVAVFILTINAGGLPWIAILLPVTFGFYAFFRKSLPIGPTEGFALETLIMTIPALIGCGYFIATGEDYFFHSTWKDAGLLVLAGPFTAIPFILFAVGAKMLNLTTLGLMQYLTPTFLFLIAIFVFHEPFSTVQLFAFSLIWLSLVIYTAASLSMKKQRQRKETIIELKKVSEK